MRIKIITLAILTTVTLAFHFLGLSLVGTIGHSHFIHVIHGRLCYIPIVLAAFWFGVRGGVMTAAVISFFTIIFVVLIPVHDPHEFTTEYLETIFYFAIGGLTGFMIDKERRILRIKEEAERKLHQAERLSMMGHMAASIAHEIKNPLGSIKGAAQILADSSTSDEDRREFTGIIEKETDRLDKVVRDFLSYSRPAPPKISEVDIPGLLAMVIKQLKYQAEIQGIKIELGTAELPPIRGDSDRLHQLFLNIVINAIQAMPDGGNINIRSSIIGEMTSGELEIRIADSGPGIPPENVDRIFEPFYSTRSQGTGLGLATAKAIVREHGGRIELDSVAGKGTVFLIRLPLEGRE